MEGSPELSIIILNYNTKELLRECLSSIKKYEEEIPLEVIVSDNASTDGSPDMVRREFPWVRLVEGENEGFAKGNNRAKNLVRGKMVLFLNPDTVVKKDVFFKTARYLKENKSVGAVSCKLVLPSGEMDKDTRRSFPTPWVSFSHLILKSDRIFPKSPLFAKYWYGYIPENVTHPVDTIQGAFFLSWKKILDKVDWFDEGYFFDGEDIDLCWQIRKAGYKIVYFPEVSVIHVKGVTKGKSKRWKHKVPLKQRIKIRLAGVNSMERFYRKNLWKKYPLAFNFFMILAIKIFKIVRWVSVRVSA